MTYEQLHVLIHFGEAISIACLLAIVWRQREIINAVTVWAKGVDDYLDSDPVPQDESA